MSYDAVLFDFDGVVAELPGRETLYDAVRRACDRVGLDGSVRETAAALRRGDADALAERCRVAGVDRETLSSLAARAVVSAQVREVETGLRSVYEDVTALRRVDRPAGVVSDNHPRALRALLERFGIADLFETVRGCPFTPEGLARRKPDPRNVEAAVADLGADDALYVGDRPVDVAAASNAGVDAALVVRDAEGDGLAPAPDDATLPVDPSPTYRLPSLEGLPDVLADR